MTWWNYFFPRGDQSQACPPWRVDTHHSREDWRTQTPLPEVVRDNIVITSDGFFVMREEQFVRSLRPAELQDLKHVFGPDVLTYHATGYVELKRKIPFAHAMQALTFFKQAWVKCQREEILIIFYYYTEKRHELFHPHVRSASGMHLDFDVPDAPADAVAFGDFHSHTASAYHSLNDRADDLKSPGVHIIIGDIYRSLQTIHCVYSDGTHTFPISVFDVFDIPQPSIRIPDAWLEDLQRPVPKGPPKHTSKYPADRRPLS